MAVYTVHAPPPRAGQGASDPERFVFVRDGFHFWAFLLTPLWLLLRRQWLALLIYVVVTTAVEIGLRAIGAGATLEIVVGLLISLLVGLEAGSIRRWTLGRRRWRTIGTVVGDDLEAAERQFFAAWVARPAPPPPVTPSQAVPTVTAVTAQRAAAAASGAEIVGLFPQPGGRA